MPATPTWPPKSTPRLFIDEPLHVGLQVHVSGGPAHYLVGVMRLKPGAPVKLFDDQNGEFLATICSAGKRDLVLEVTQKLRDREDVPDIWLVQALVKKDRFDWIAEKACELGAARFVPVITARCVVDKLKEDRLRAQMIEAAE
ncbi:MAG: RsmE family RNA methyltransferase, partial [Sphingorhabdus sp.]